MSMRFHQGAQLQRGRGLGSIFAGLLRSFFPIAKAGLNAGKRVLQSEYAKNLASKTLDIGKTLAKNVAANVLSGESLSNSASNELETAKKKLGEAIRGSGRKRKANHKKIKCSKKICKGNKRYCLLE